MNIAIGVGVYVMLFGGLVLSDPDTPPQRSYPLPAAAHSPGAVTAPGGFGLPSAQAGAYGGRGRSAYGQQVTQPINPRRFMPTAPTAFGGEQGAGSAASPFLSPTERPDGLGGGPTGNFDDQPNAGNPLGPMGGQKPGFGLPGMPRRFSQPMPSRRPSSASRRHSRYGGRHVPRSYAEFRIQQTQFTPAGSLGMGTRSPSTRGAAPAAGAKPFSGYRQRPAISPYMGLFRYDSPEAVDNYSTYVKPQLDQNRNNTMVGGQIRSLDNRSRYQGDALQSLGDQTRALQGRGTHSYFMNRQSYFGGGR